MFLPITSIFKVTGFYQHCKSFTHPPPRGSRSGSSWGQCWSGTCTSPGQSLSRPWHAGTTCGGHYASRQSDGSSWSRD